jgi:hypothetical protein
MNIIMIIYVQVNFKLTRRSRVGPENPGMAVILAVNRALNPNMKTGLRAWWSRSPRSESTKRHVNQQIISSQLKKAMKAVWSGKIEISKRMEIRLCPRFIEPRV